MDGWTDRYIVIFKEFLTFNFVFQSITGSDLEKEHSDLASSPFDIHNGPLWKARLMTSPENTPCRFPDVKAKFPHQYSLLLSIHHGANDGIVLMLVIDSLLSIMDHLLQGLPVDRQQVGELRDGIEAREEENRIKSAFENDPARLKTALQKYEMCKHIPLLIEAFGTPSEGNPGTHVFLPVLLDQDVMSRIAHKCRSLGITMNTFIAAICNTGLVEIVRDAGLKRNTYSITTVLPVSIRRLMAKSSKPYLGFLGSQMPLNMATPHNVKNHFWEYAKNLDTVSRNKLKRNCMCEHRVLSAIMRPEGYTLEAYYAHPLPLCYDYMLTNIYSPYYNTQGTGEFIQITDIKNGTYVHKTPFPVCYGFSGFSGQLRMELGYSMMAHSKKVMRRWLDKNVAVIHDISSALT